MEVITALTVEQLSERWQLSKSKIYEDVNAGKLPHLPNARNRFPITAIEDIENEAMFDKSNLKTPRERKLERELQERDKLLTYKEEEINKLRRIVAQIQTYSTEAIYMFNKEA